MKTKTTPPSVLLTSPVAGNGFTLGLDLGDRAHHVCVLDATGQIVHEAALPNTRPALAKLLAQFPQATVAVEAGSQPWLRPGAIELAWQVKLSLFHYLTLSDGFPTLHALIYENIGL